MSAGRLNLADVEDGCYLTADDLLNTVLTLVEYEEDLADRLSRLLTGDPGRTLWEMMEILDVGLYEVCHTFAVLSQAGAVFVVLDVAGGEKGYRLEGWV